MYTVADFELWDQNVGVVENCVARIHNFCQVDQRLHTVYHNTTYLTVSHIVKLQTLLW